MGKPGSTFIPFLLLHRRRWTGPKAEVGLFFYPYTQCLLCASVEQGNVGVISRWYACESCSLTFFWPHCLFWTSLWKIQIMVIKYFGGVAISLRQVMQQTVLWSLQSEHFIEIWVLIGWNLDCTSSSSWNIFNGLSNWFPCFEQTMQWQNIMVAVRVGFTPCPVSIF